MKVAVSRMSEKTRFGGALGEFPERFAHTHAPARGRVSRVRVSPRSERGFRHLGKGDGILCNVFHPFKEIQIVTPEEFAEVQ
jgi:hypothetical protein